jgi:glycosyltransferase involved in cell wall biosynthesis
MSPAQASQLAVGAGVAFGALAACTWVALGSLLCRGSRFLRGIGSAAPLPDDALPRLTIISTARDEAARIEHAVRSLLGQDYPGVEILLVDDRSTDGTATILDRIAAAEPRLRVAHITTLPPGWLGKCHALALAAAEARGEWILFTDGDVWMAPDAARRAVSMALELGADHLAVGADLEIDSLGERIFITYFTALFFATQRPWKASDPRSKAHIGIGAFNLVRRETYVRAGGHERLRMEVLDDLGLGLIVKESGGRSHFALHDGFLRVRWHEGVRGLIRGVEKNAFAALRYRVGETTASVALQFLGSVAPAAGLLLPGFFPALFAAISWVGIWVLYRAIRGYVRLRWWDFLTAPVGAALFSYSILRSMVVTLRRGGVTWRGTHYKLEELRRGMVR